MEKTETIIPNGTGVIFGYSSFAKKGIIVGYKEKPEAYYILTDDGKAEMTDPENIRIVPPQKPKNAPANYVGKAYKIWVIGAFLSLLGIFAGQWLGDLYKNPTVYYTVSGIWALIMVGTSAAIGFIYISKSKF